MTPTAAAKAWLAADADLKDAQHRRDEAAGILKAHFHKSGKALFRGVRYAESTYTQLDTAKARELLGAKAAQAEVVRTRVTLSAA